MLGQGAISEFNCIITLNMIYNVDRVIFVSMYPVIFIYLQIIKYPNQVHLCPSGRAV